MKKRSKWTASALAGGAAGLANGFFGGGGGMVLVPLLTGRCGLDQRRAFATSVAVILPLCMLSAGIYWWKGGLDFVLALPYLLGGFLGGFLGGKLFRGVNMVWLRRAFALLILYGGGKALFF
ncbi:TSUP family transporter [Pseudoflavonifractor sp. 524-17]|uniref:TSUP family transporter n=1 Tax=Pseudoflavonifractor sp. 524-17 TaxID=2304577 RepID=UPI00325AFB99